MSRSHSFVERALECRWWSGLKCWDYTHERSRAEGILKEAAELIRSRSTDESASASNSVEGQLFFLRPAKGDDIAHGVAVALLSLRSNKCSHLLFRPSKDLKTLSIDMASVQTPVKCYNLDDLCVALLQAGFKKPRPVDLVDMFLPADMSHLVEPWHRDIREGRDRSLAELELFKRPPGSFLVRERLEGTGIEARYQEPRSHCISYVGSNGKILHSLIRNDLRGPQRTLVGFKVDGYPAQNSIAALLQTLPFVNPWPPGTTELDARLLTFFANCRRLAVAFHGTVASEQYFTPPRWPLKPMDIVKVQEMGLLLPSFREDWMDGLRWVAKPEVQELVFRSEDEPVAFYFQDVDAPVAESAAAASGALWIMDGKPLLYGRRFKGEHGHDDPKILDIFVAVGTEEEVFSTNNAPFQFEPCAVVGDPCASSELDILTQYRTRPKHQLSDIDRSLIPSVEFDFQNSARFQRLRFIDDRPVQLFDYVIQPILVPIYTFLEDETPVAALRACVFKLPSTGSVVKSASKR